MNCDQVSRQRNRMKEFSNSDLGFRVLVSEILVCEATGVVARDLRQLGIGQL